MEKSTLKTRVSVYGGIIEIFLCLKFSHFTAMVITIVDGKIIKDESFINIKLPKTCGEDGENKMYNFTKNITGLSKQHLYIMYKEVLQDYWNENPEYKQKMQDFHLNRALKYS